jgi:hypothetical protein
MHEKLHKNGILDPNTFHDYKIFVANNKVTHGCKRGEVDNS